jgi:hypothetical protein
MTAYRDRLEAGVYDAKKQAAEAQKNARAKADKVTKARAARATTSKSTKGLR